MHVPVEPRMPDYVVAEPNLAQVCVEWSSFHLPKIQIPCPYGFGEMVHILEIHLKVWAGHHSCWLRLFDNSQRAFAGIAILRDSIYWSVLLITKNKTA